MALREEVMDNGKLIRRPKVRDSSSFGRSILGLLVALAVATAWAAAAQADAEAKPLRHLALRTSLPEADATVGPDLAEIRLFFTEAPRLEGTSIRIADEETELVASSQATADRENPSQVFIRPDASLKAGIYRVHWRAIAQDGHAVNGDFGFRVAAE